MSVLSEIEIDLLRLKTTKLIGLRLSFSDNFGDSQFAQTVSTIRVIVNTNVRAFNDFISNVFMMSKQLLF
jgi:hypothetical protein